MDSHRRKFLSGFALSIALFAFSAADQPAGTKVWDFYTGASIQSSPAIGQHGILYFGTDSGKLYSFYPDGRGIWEYPTGDRIVGSPAIAADGTVIFGSTDGILYAVQPDGREKWRFQANGPIASSPAIGPDGTVVFGTMSKRLFAVRADGSKLWDLESSSAVVGSPAIGGGWVVLVTGADGTVAAINIRNGEVLWQFEAPNSIVSSPAIGADGTIYFGCFDGHLYALSPEGKKLWTYATGAPVKSSPVIGPDGVIYVGSDDKLLYALAPDGFKKWTFSVGAPIRSTPAVASDGTVYVGSYDKVLYAVSPKGVKQWEFVTDENVTSSPAIAEDGTVFFGSWNGRFYAVKGTTGLASGVWPRFRGNAAQSGYRGSTQSVPAQSITSTESLSIVANNRVETVPETTPVKRSKGSWWSKVFGSDSRTAKNRGVIGQGSATQVARNEPKKPEPKAVPEADPKVISDARQLVNVESESANAEATVRTVTHVESTPTVVTSTVMIQDPPVIVQPPSPDRERPVATAGAAIPMMTLINAPEASPAVPVPTKPAPSAIPAVTSIPVVEPVKTNVPEPVSPLTRDPAPVPATKATSTVNTAPMKMIDVSSAPKAPPVSVLETSVINQPAPPVKPAPAAPVKPATTRDGRLPMMRLIESGSKTSSVTTEGAISTVTFGTAATGVGVESVTTEGLPASEPVVEISSVEETVAKETITVPAPPKPVSVNAQIREPRYVPGLLRSLVTGEKRRGGDPTPPAPEVQSVEVRERNYQPGFLQRLVRRGTRPASKTERSAEVAARSEVSEPSEEDLVGGNSAIVSVETIEVDDEAAEVAGATVAETATKEVDDAEVGGLRVISDSSELFGSKGKASQVAEVAVIEDPVVAMAAEEPEPGPAPASIDEKIAVMENRVEKMSAAVKDSRRELEELKAAEPLAEPVEDPLVAKTIASLQPKPEPVTVDPEERIIPDSDPATEQALAAAFGDKLSRLESHLISLNEELADARVERARLRQELAAARTGKGSPVTSESSDLLTPVPKVAAPRIENVAVDPKPEQPSIPQPEWLKNEVRSVLAAAGEQWEQPPGAPAAPTVSNWESVPVTPTPAATEVAAAVEPAAVVESIPVTEPEKTKPAAPEKARRPGFFSRLFGRKPKPAETRTAATNIVIVPPSVSDFPGAPPTDAQLMGTDTRFGNHLTPTNFPRIPYQPDKNASFIQPGAGNLTQLPGFPRPKPKLIPPPAREMEQNIQPGPGLRDLNVEESVTLVAPPNAGKMSAPSHKPQVIIVSPPDNAPLNKPVLDLRGMVKSARRVAQVLVSVGGADFVPAAGLESWSHQTPVERGLVLVRVKAINADGVESEIETRSYHYHSLSRMTVKVVGQGRVSPDLNGQELNVGQPYTITAEPAAGQEFVGWSGAVTGSRPKVSFMMNKDLWLQAEFRPLAPAIESGRFTGLVHPQNEIRADRSGSIDLQIDAAGNYTGALQFAGATHSLRGRFDAQWQAAETVQRVGAEALAVALRMDRATGGESITGYFELAGEPVVARAFRTLNAGGTITVIRPGSYRMLMPAPEDRDGPGGIGFGEVSVAADGKVQFSFQLPDGTPVKQSTQLSRKGLWPLYVPLYGGRGALAGWISSTDKAEFSLYGDLRWLKPADANHPRGFAVRRFIYGKRTSPSSAGMPRRTGGRLVAAR